MTPIWQGPLSAGVGGLVVALAFAGFLMADLVGGTEVVAAGGGVCADANDASHKKMAAAAKVRTTKYSGDDGTLKRLSQFAAGYCGDLKLERV
jgi:hypothetical protein